MATTGFDWVNCERKGTAQKSWLFLPILCLHLNKDLEFDQTCAKMFVWGNARGEDPSLWHSVFLFALCSHLNAITNAKQHSSICKAFFAESYLLVLLHEWLCTLLTSEQTDRRFDYRHNQIRIKGVARKAWSHFWQVMTDNILWFNEN